MALLTHTHTPLRYSSDEQADADRVLKLVTRETGLPIGRPQPTEFGVLPWLRVRGDWIDVSDPAVVRAIQTVGLGDEAHALRLQNMRPIANIVGDPILFDADYGRGQGTYRVSGIHPDRACIYLQPFFKLGEDSDGIWRAPAGPVTILPPVSENEAVLDTIAPTILSLEQDAPFARIDYFSDAVSPIYTLGSYTDLLRGRRLIKRKKLVRYTLAPAPPLVLSVRDSDIAALAIQAFNERVRGRYENLDVRLEHVNEEAPVPRRAFVQLVMISDLDAFPLGPDVVATISRALGELGTVRVYSVYMKNLEAAGLHDLVWIAPTQSLWTVELERCRLTGRTERAAKRVPFLVLTGCDIASLENIAGYSDNLEERGTRGSSVLTANAPGSALDVSTQWESIRGEVAQITVGSLTSQNIQDLKITKRFVVDKQRAPLVQNPQSVRIPDVAWVELQVERSAWYLGGTYHNLTTLYLGFWHESGVISGLPTKPGGFPPVKPLESVTYLELTPLDAPSGPWLWPARDTLISRWFPGVRTVIYDRTSIPHTGSKIDMERVNMPGWVEKWLFLNPELWVEFQDDNGAPLPVVSTIEGEGENLQMAIEPGLDPRTDTSRNDEVKEYRQAWLRRVELDMRRPPPGEREQKRRRVAAQLRFLQALGTAGVEIGDAVARLDKALSTSTDGYKGHNTPSLREIL